MRGVICLVVYLRGYQATAEPDSGVEEPGVSSTYYLTHFSNLAGLLQCGKGSIVNQIVIY